MKLKPKKKGKLGRFLSLQFRNLIYPGHGMAWKRSKESRKDSGLLGRKRK